MCALCGVILNQHWAEQDGGRRARVFRAALLDRVLGHFGLSLHDWAGAVYVLRDRKGSSAVVQDIGAVWSEAERLLGRHARPARRRSRRRAEPVKTPVVLVTGFLGSGKTTLISRLLEHPDMGETAVIVNELGEIGIDHHLLRRVDERTVLLASGCVCCVLRGDLADELRDLLDRRDAGEVPHFGRVVVETTGVADPTPIVMTLLSDPVVRNHYELESVVATSTASTGCAGPSPSSRPPSPTGS